MLRVGLSGGIGSGKSTVAHRLRELGAVVIDADLLAREVVATGSEGLDAVVRRFGDGVLDDDGVLNRAALGALVFSDVGARRDLEGITHPLIARRTKELLAAAPHDAVTVHDVPLLVEKAMGAAYHLVVVVGAGADLRVKRLMHSRGMTETDARSRIAAQATDEERRRAADVWLDNEGRREDLAPSVERLWHERLVPFEHNVRHGVRSRPPEALVLVPSDPGWAAAAQRLLARLRLAFGTAMVTGDHVGSTAVPGLLSKDVVDLQVGVRTLDAADDETVRARLDAAGFPRAQGVYADFDRGSEGLWPKRMHGNADPGRVTHVHVREVGSPGWRWALMFRDWMRADPAARRDYEAEKRRLASAGATTAEYAAAKEPWFDSVHPRAEAWARETGWAPADGLARADG
ncbi:dephospho-CoA kinase [Pedococcus sp. 5OH_020]|uniref:dephospho-CoA kinase n=1 Tax=Pedococcus sp. 5OH_020 TaxID=2989814 RepID=UPI0022E9F911|nr:dephospho-CoA kinase [Pedococcus sp. 5OH_020]